MKKFLFLLACWLALPLSAIADDIISTAYGAARAYNFSLRDSSDLDVFLDAVDFTTGSCASSACCKVSIDGGALASCDNQPTALASGGYNFTASAAEMVGCQVKYYIQDATATERWPDKAISFMTYGNASACHQTPDVNVASFSTGALTNTAISNDTFRTAQFQDGFLTEAKHADNSVSARVIDAAAIGASELATDAIGAAEVATAAWTELLNIDVEDWATGIGAYLDAIKKYAANRVFVSGGNYTVYKDDQTTTYETGTTGAAGRDPT